MWKALLIASRFGEGGEKKRVPYIHKPEHLCQLAHSKSADIRYSVARSVCAPPSVLKYLAQDESWVVRMAVAWHKETPAATLSILVNDPEPAVSRAANLHSLMQPPEPVIAEPNLEAIEDTEVEALG